MPEVVEAATNNTLGSSRGGLCAAGARLEPEAIWEGAARERF